MSISQYRFVSPGVFINEIDNSQLPQSPLDIGPVVIGRALRGPSMRPVLVESFSQFVEIFGNPVSGGIGGDIWRDGNKTSPMYAGYAAQAHLANRTPLTFIRLLGYHHEDRANGSIEAGWATGLAYGLFIAPTSPGTGGVNRVNAALSAIVYVADETKKIGLTGRTVNGTLVEQKCGVWVASQGIDHEFVVAIDDNEDVPKKYPLNFARTSKKFVRRALNTNPTLTNIEIVNETSDSFKTYWLGETFESHLESLLSGTGVVPGDSVAILLPLNDETGVTEPKFDKSQLKIEAKPPKTSWVISQHLESHEQFEFNKDTYELEGVKKLFRFVGLNDGEWNGKRIKVGFSDIKASNDEFNSYGSFTVILRVTSDNDNSPEYVERYTNCNLDPSSLDYVGRKIGDMDSIWDYSESRYRMIGQHPNRSKFVRVEIDNEVDAGTTDSELLPFGFYGPSRPRPVLTTTALAGADGAGLVDDAQKTSGVDLGSPLGAAIDISSAPATVQPTTLGNFYYNGVAGHEFRLVWPAMLCRQSSTTGNLSNGRRSYFGTTSAQLDGVKEDTSYCDLTRPYSSVDSDLETILIAGEGLSIPQLKSDGSFDGDNFSEIVEESIDFTDRTGATPALPTENVNAGESITIGGVTFEFGVDAAVGATLLDSLNNLVDAINATDFGGGVGLDLVVELKTLSDRYILCIKAGESDFACAPPGVNASLSVLEVGQVDPDTQVDYNAAASGSYSSTVVKPGVRPGSYQLVITDSAAGTAEISDDGLGNLQIDSQSLSGGVTLGGAFSGTIDYDTGAVSIALDQSGPIAPDPLAGFVATYDGLYSGISELGTEDDALVAEILTTNVCGTLDVRAAAGEYFGNGIVPYFSLDDLVMQDVDQGSGVFIKSRQHVDWKPGSRFAGASVTVRGVAQEVYDSISCGSLTGDKPGTYRDILEHGYDQFTMPLVGGFEGFDITEKDPLRNTLLDGKNELTHYAFNTIKRGIDTVADPEVAEMNLLVAPGVTNPSLTTHMVEVSKERGDTLAIIDLEKDYVPRHEGLEDEFSRLPDPDLAISLLKDRRINNSYGCAYFPWVQIRDNVNFASLWVPPSVAALGTFAYSETRPGSELWFAPAGFNRGGLTSGAAGVPVTNVRYKLTSKERDRLYEANINPIASFPSEGIVVFGNKTLQVTPSALDRVNVRRLMIFLKKRVSRIASTILFDQNVQATWNRFKFQVEPLLADVKARFGLTDWRLVLDETTTTPDLIDRNILYAKIFLKPARAIEFIAIDFNITRTGASFTD